MTLVNEDVCGLFVCFHRLLFADPDIYFLSTSSCFLVWYPQRAQTALELEQKHLSTDVTRSLVIQGTTITFFCIQPINRNIYVSI